MHALANHELLALELFASALLRFPDAPPGLRRGWVQSMRDEQRHMCQYLTRLEAVGGHLGDAPMSAFFWDALGNVPTSLELVAGLQVCLEQANLDFARAWSVAFVRVGDAETAAVLDEVYDDEIRHLRLGVHWLRELKSPEQDDFEAFSDALSFPLTVARARGPKLDVEGRRSAGLSDAFIERLHVTEVSKGRSPRVLWFEPQVEDQVAGRTVARSPVADDLAVLPALFARAGDAVVAPVPSTSFLVRWREVGLVIPQFIPKLDAAFLPGGRAGGLVPWGWSPHTAAQSAALGGHFDVRWRDLFDKAWAAEQLARFVAERPGPFALEHVGVRCRTVSEVEHARARIEGPVWIKAGLSTAGQHRVKVTTTGLEPKARRWLDTALAHGDVVVEAHLPVLAEFSAHVDVGPDRVRMRNIVRFGASGGIFRGSVVGPATAGLPAEQVRWLHEVEAWAHLEAAACQVGTEALARGYQGPLAIDALLAEGGVLKPISEVNPRMTMGRLSLELRRRVAGQGVWLFLPVIALRRAGFADCVQFVDWARQQWPDVWKGSRLAQGVVATNEPAKATQLLTLLWVGRSYRGAQQGLRELFASVDGNAAPITRAVAWALACD